MGKLVSKGIFEQTVFSGDPGRMCTLWFPMGSKEKEKTHPTFFPLSLAQGETKNAKNGGESR
jgi:hypothetical protein